MMVDAALGRAEAARHVVDGGGDIAAFHEAARRRFQDIRMRGVDRVFRYAERHALCFPYPAAGPAPAGDSPRRTFTSARMMNILLGMLSTRRTPPQCCKGSRADGLSGRAVLGRRQEGARHRRS